MRWNMLDHVDAFTPWQNLLGRKCVSLEEGYLLGRFGRTGIFPESLLVESLVQHCRWFVIASSNFSQTALLDEIAELHIKAETRMGDVLKIEVLAETHTEENIMCVLQAWVGEELHVQGCLRMQLAPLSHFSHIETTRLMWEEFYAKA